MNFGDLNNFTLFLIFFIPGFISIKVYDLLIPNQKRDISKSLYEIVAFSTLNFILFFWLIDIIIKPHFYAHHPVVFCLSLIILFLLFPAVWPFLYIKLYDWSWFSKYVVDLSPTAWDYMFRKKKTHWVIIHLKDKRKIGGLFGLDSYTSTFPHEEQIYLQETWKLDDEGNFIEKLERTKGILVLKDEIMAIEFFN